MDGISEETRTKIAEALREPFPRELHETQQGFTYVAAEFWIERIIEITDNRYDFSIQDRWESQIPGTFKDGKQSPPQTVFNVSGRICIDGLGCRDDIGVQPVQPGMNDAWKGAVSDCIKRCLKNFGMGLELWKGGFKANQINQQNGQAQQQNVTTIAPQQKQQVTAFVPPQMTDPQRKKLAAELRNNGIDPEKVFHEFKTDNDGSAITKALASTWIDSLVKGMVPPRLSDFIGTAEGSAGSSPEPKITTFQQPQSAVPPMWTHASLNLNLPKDEQKTTWHAAVKHLAEAPQYDQEEWFKKVVGAGNACGLDSVESQSWRFSTIAIYAPTLEVLEYIENQADQASAVTPGLMQRLGERAEAIAQA